MPHCNRRDVSPKQRQGALREPRATEAVTEAHLGHFKLEERGCCAIGASGGGRPKGRSAGGLGEAPHRVFKRGGPSARRRRKQPLRPPRTASGRARCPATSQGRHSGSSARPGQPRHAASAAPAQRVLPPGSSLVAGDCRRPHRPASRLPHLCLVSASVAPAGSGRAEGGTGPRGRAEASPLEAAPSWGPRRACLPPHGASHA